MNFGEFNQLEFNQESTIAVIVSPSTPSCRIASIISENRIYVVPPEDRTHEIPYENRTVTIICQ